MSNEICIDLEKLHPVLKTKAVQLLAECKKVGINLRVTETYRTIARQDYLYAQGRTRPGNIITYSRGVSKSSYHQWGLAFDVCNNVKGDAYNHAILARAGAIGKKLGLEWGGDFQGFYDAPHFQITFGLSINDLNAGKRPPTVALNTPDYTKYNSAVVRLNKKSVITTPAAWAPEKINLAYVPALFDNIGRILLGVTGYENIIDRLVRDKVMHPDSAVSVWKAKKYRDIHVHALIEKVAEKYA